MSILVSEAATDSEPRVIVLDDGPDGPAHPSSPLWRKVIPWVWMVVQAVVLVGIVIEARYYGLELRRYALGPVREHPLQGQPKQCD